MSGDRPVLDWSTISVGDAFHRWCSSSPRPVSSRVRSRPRDFMPVHHDRDYAISQGAPEIFMNILSDTAYSSRFLTDWAGPEAMVKRLAIRLGVPACAGSTLTYTGTVTATGPQRRRGNRRDRVPSRERAGRARQRDRLPDAAPRPDRVRTTPDL